MRKTLGVIIAVVGGLLAAYVGLWLMFVGGIIQIVDAVQEDPVEGAEIAWGIVRVVFAGAATTLTFWAIGFVAFLVGGWGETSKYGRDPYRKGVLR
jgi:uncharacterized BrkB/YihY/UPF0761 family membrane protein